MFLFQSDIMKSLFISAYALVHVSPYLSHLSDLRTAGTGHIYYDGDEYYLCRRAASIEVHLGGYVPPPREQAVRTCPDETSPALLSYDADKDVVSLSGTMRQWCFGVVDETEGIFLGRIGDTSDVSAQVHCISVDAARYGRRLRIDWELLSGQSKVMPWVHIGSERCTALASLLSMSAEGSTLFTLFTGMGARRREVEYWLDYCGISLPTAHLWEYDDYCMDSNSSLCQFVSRCNIRRATPLELFRQTDRPSSADIFCMEDFLGQLWATSASSLHKKVTLISAGVGPTSPVETVVSNRRGWEGITEILSAASAFLETKFDEFEVHFMWAVPSEVKDPLASYVDEAVRNVIEANTERWMEAMEELWGLAAQCADADGGKQTQTICWKHLSFSLAHALKHVGPNSFDAGGANEVPSLIWGTESECQRFELARFLRRVATSTSNFDWRHFRMLSRENNDAETFYALGSVSPSAQCALPAFVGMAPPVGQLMVLSRWLEGSSLLGTTSRPECAEPGPSTATTKPENIFFQFLGFTPEGPPRSGPDNQYDVQLAFSTSKFDGDEGVWEREILNIKNSEGKIYVLCFVKSELDLTKARKIVQHWREGCDGCRFHAVFTIYVVPECGTFVGDSELDDLDHCSLRFALLAIYEWIVTNTVKVDLIVSLIGIDAMLAFRRPGVSDSGIIPNGQYGGFAHYRLRAPISVAFRASTSSGAVSGKGTVKGMVDFRAFAGVASAVKTMIETARKDDPFYFLGGGGSAVFVAFDGLHHVDGIEGAGLARALLRQIRRRYRCLRSGRFFDIDAAFFDFNSETWDSDVLSAKINRDYVKSGGHDNEAEYLKLLLSDRDNGDVLLPLIRRGEPVRLTELAAQLKLAAALMNREECLDSLIAAGKLYHVYQKVLPQVPGGLNFYLEFAKKFYLYSHRTSLADKIDMLGILRLIELGSSPDLFPPHVSGALGIHRIVYKIAQASIYQEIGPVDLEVQSFGSTVVPVPFSTLRRERAAILAPSVPVRPPRTFILTVASDETDGLRALLTSGYLAGVEVEVIGIGREYTDYTQKIVWYLEALEGVNTTLRMIDDDIVVLIDAYDVILFPAARRISQTLQTFSTPVVFCSENGIYPEFAAPWYYARGSMYWNSFNEHNQGDQRYLNSGCIAGSRRAVREMLHAVTARNEVFRDDQEVFVRYLLENPHLVSIDTERKLFLTAYKEPMHSYAIDYTLGLTTVSGRETMLPGTISLIHCNNKNSNNAYYSVRIALDSFYNKYLCGQDGPALLSAIRAIWDRDWITAKWILSQDAVVHNASTPDGQVGSYGGSNTLSLKLGEIIFDLESKN